MENLKVFQRVAQAKVTATVVIDDVREAIPLAETSLESGISSIELASYKRLQYAHQ